MASAAKKQMTQCWVEINTNTVALFRLYKGNYDSGLANVCGLNFSRVPDGKSVVKGSVRRLVRQGLLANFRIIVEKTANINSTHTIYCARSNADNVLAENGAASQTFGGKKIVSVNGITG